MTPTRKNPLANLAILLEEFVVYGSIFNASLLAVLLFFKDDGFMQSFVIRWFPSLLPTMKALIVQQNYFLLHLFMHVVSIKKNRCALIRSLHINL